MINRTAILIGTLAVLAGCADPESRLAAAPDDGTDQFAFVAQSYDLYPIRTDIGEAWRLESLRTNLAAAELCPSRFAVDEREDLVDEGDVLGNIEGDIYQVTYRGHCIP